MTRLRYREAAAHFAAAANRVPAARETERIDYLRRQLLVHASATKRSTDFIALLDQLGAAYGTTERTRPLVAVLDNGPIHTSKLTTKALAQRPWLTLEWLPKYAPELNDPGSRPGQAIEQCWHDLKQHQLANRTPAFTGAGSSPIPTLSPASSLTPSPVSTTSDNSNHRPFAGGLLSGGCYIIPCRFSPFMAETWARFPGAVNRETGGPEQGR